MVLRLGPVGISAGWRTRRTDHPTPHGAIELVARAFYFGVGVGRFGGFAIARGIPVSATHRTDGHERKARIWMSPGIGALLGRLTRRPREGEQKS